MLQEQKRCPAFSSVWLVGINFLYFLVGMILIGLSSWGITQASSDVVTQALPSGGLGVLVAVGVFLMVVAIIGWAGVKFNYKMGGRYVLGVYATTLIILMIMEFSAAIVLVNFTGRLGNWGPADAVNDYGMFMLVNQSYADCCCNLVQCPNGTCWLPASLLYPCDSIDRFKSYLVTYIDDRITPIVVIAILIGLVQFFTAVAACCNQCKGKAAEAQRPIGGPLSYDGYADEGADGSGTYGYESYVKGSSSSKPSTTGAAAPRAGGAPAGRPAGGAGAGAAPRPAPRRQ